MAKYDILGDIVSPEALAQLKELEKIANNIGGKLKGITLAGMSDKGEAAFIQKLNAETALLIKQEERLQQTIAKGNAVKQAKVKLTQQEAVTQAALNNVSKLRAVLASQETSALQKLDAQIRLNVLEAQKYVAAGDTQNANYLKLIANTKQLSNEYDRMAKASGSNMVKTQSMYGATFQLTQVMRELPNFAIDARIGFMSLSNNLPMLTDSFMRLSKEIDVNTGKMYGFGGAAKQFGKSLLSMNTIMIVASTLLVLFGDDLVEVFTGKMSIAEKAVESFNKKLGEGNNKYTDNLKIMHELDYMLKNINLKYIEERDIIEKYNSTLGVHYGELKNIADIKDFLNKKNEAYIQISLLQMEADEALTMAFNAQSKKRMLERNNEVSFWKKTWDVIATVASDQYMFGSQKEKDSLLLIAMTGGRTKQQRLKEASDLKAEADDAIKMALDVRSKMDKIAQDAGIDLYPNKDTTNGVGGRTRTGSMKEIDLRTFNLDRLAIQKEMSKNELDMQEATAKGELNSFEQRIKAAKDFYSNKASLIYLETKDAETNLDEKKINDKKELDDQRDKNKKLYDAKDISAKEFEKLESDYFIAVENLNKNYNVDIAELQLKRQEEEQNALLAHQNNLLKITKDYFDRQKTLEATRVAEQNALTDKETSNKKKQSFFRRLLGTGSASTSFGEGLADKQGEVAKIDNEIYAQNRLLENTKFTEEQKNAIKEKIAELNEKRQKKQIELEESVEDRKLELAKQGEQKIIEFLTEAWNQFFAYLNEQLEKESERQTKIEDERYKDIEDREKAGVLTKKEAEEEKLRTEAYYQSVQDEIDRKQEENDRNKFLLEQAAALAQVWINFGLATASLENMLLGGTLTPLYATIAGASSALILAQSIPAFEQGGIVAKDGTILAGEKRHELAILPDGSFFVTANKPTLYDVPKGTEIMPDLNKIDIMDILHLKPLYANHSDNKQTDALLRKIDSSIRNQKQGNFYGMPLIKQLDSRGRFDNRRKSLMN